MIFSREWSMPNRATFDIPPIKKFVDKYLQDSKLSIDPFSGNKKLATYTNDLNPEYDTNYHLKTEEFCVVLQNQHIIADLLIFDPPYSPRQITECYKSIGLQTTQQDTQCSFYSKVKDSATPLLAKDSIVLSFGWNSSGFGKTRGFEIIEILMVCHGGAHNDTICLAERKL